MSMGKYVKLTVIAEDAEGNKEILEIPVATDVKFEYHAVREQDLFATPYQFSYCPDVMDINLSCTALYDRKTGRILKTTRVSTVEEVTADG